MARSIKKIATQKEAPPTRHDPWHRNYPFGNEPRSRDECLVSIDYRTNDNAAGPMVNPISLKAVNQRIDELIRQYDALGQNDRRGPDTIEELSQLNVVRDELDKVYGKVQADRMARFMIPDAEFPTLGALYRRMDCLAQKIAETQRDDPRRPDIVNELTSLSILAHSVKTHPADAATSYF